MSNRRAAGPRARWLIGAAAVALALVIVWALLVPGADWLARHDIGSGTGSLAAARDAARGRLLTLGAGLLAAGALLFTARNFALSRRTFELTEQGQVTDRFTKAIEQLGSDKLDVRIGGIYALERIARDSAKDQPTVMEVLTAFIREHSREPWPESDAGQPVQERLTRPDVQAAVTVVGRRDAEHDSLFWHMDLAGADLTRAHLTGANLLHAHLTGAVLTGADLTVAGLAYAVLTGADLTGADLSDALLVDANLTGADLTRAVLTAAHLSDALLVDANLTRADLTRADLTDADLTRADLTGVGWPEGAQVPDGWVVGSDTGRPLRPFRAAGRLKRAGQLSEVTAHYLW